MTWSHNDSDSSYMAFRYNTASRIQYDSDKRRMFLQLLPHNKHTIPRHYGRDIGRPLQVICMIKSAIYRVYIKTNT